LIAFSGNRSLARDLRLHLRLQPEEDTPVQDDNPAASAARELKAAAREALRMGSLWTHHAIQWVDERRNEMNNRNREQEQRERERSERNRYSTSGYGSDEGDYGPAQYGRQNEQSGLSGGARRASQARDRDVQGDYSSGGWLHGRGSQPGYGREGSDLQAQGESGLRDDYGTYGRGGRPQYRQDVQGSGTQERGSQRYGAQGAGQSRYGIEGSRYGSQGYGAGSESFESQDFAQDYSQGSSHYGSQGFGAQGSSGVYGPQGFGSQGSRSSSDYERQSGYGGYSFGGHGGLSQEGRDYSANPGVWRASDTSGRNDAQGSQYGQSQGSRPGISGAASYRGRGPKNYTRSDERIREDLNERLTDSDEIDASNITVEVSNGVATLKGSVDERWMKHCAEDLAESCSGVRDVNNQIRVQSQAASQGTSRSPISGSSASSGGSSPEAGASPGAPGSTTTGKTGGSSTHN
jgi:osmotically-inducible protein OsmY